MSLLLLQVVPDIKPAVMILDMEKAATNAFLHVFGDTTIHYCYFHWRQALRENLKKKGCLKVKLQ